MASKNFTATVDAWVLKSQRRLDAVVRSSAQAVIKDAQVTVAQGGRMPVDTGFLRNSLVSTLHGGFSMRGGDAYSLVVAGMRAGQSVVFMWTANYARPVEYGSNGRPGRFFSGGAARKWQAIVKEQIAKAKASVG